MMQSEEKLFHGADRERERITIWNKLWSVLHSKGLLSKGKGFSRALYHLVRRHLFHSNPYDLVVSPKGEKKNLWRSQLWGSQPRHTNGSLLIRLQNIYLPYPTAHQQGSSKITLNYSWKNSKAKLYLRRRSFFFCN